MSEDQIEESYTAVRKSAVLYIKGKIEDIIGDSQDYFEYDGNPCYYVWDKIESEYVDQHGRKVMTTFDNLFDWYDEMFMNRPFPKVRYKDGEWSIL